MRLSSAIPSSVRIAGEVIFLSYPGQPRTCRRCGEEGHLAQGCKKPRCFNCEAPGHVSSECDRDTLCGVCLKADHHEPDCPYVILSANVESVVVSTPSYADVASPAAPPCPMHLSCPKQAEIFERSWRGKCYWSFGTGKSAGVAVLLPPHFSGSVLCDSDGRILSILFTFGPLSKLNVINIYAPNLVSERKTYGAATRILNGVRTTRMRLSSSIPSSIRIAGEPVFISYPGQPKTYRRCGEEGHMAKVCGKPPLF